MLYSMTSMKNHISEPADRYTASMTSQPSNLMLTLRSIVTLVGLSLVSSFAVAITMDSKTLQIGGLAILLLIQAFLIIVLQRSRMRNKRAQKQLRDSKQALEQRVRERTEKLRLINNQLHEEIAKHEITEDLFRETQHVLNAIINAIPSALIGFTPDGTVAQWNPGAETLLRISARDALGRGLQLVLPSLGETTHQIHHAVKHRQPYFAHNVQLMRDHEVIFLDVAVYPIKELDFIGAVLRIDDVTHAVQLENMILQKEKMASLGELAAGMAHEINNPLAIIMQSIQNIERRSDPDNPVNQQAAKQLNLDLKTMRHYMAGRMILKFQNNIKDAAKRASGIVTNMLEFSRAGNENLEPVDLYSLVERGIELATASLMDQDDELEQTVLIENRVSKQIPAVLGATNELEQVLINLIQNALQALKGDNDQKKPEIIFLSQDEQDTVQLIIRDNGPGMSQAVLNHIFEPFYTTKKVRQGTGLGLSICYFIITEHHQGEIWADSQPGQGTSFHIRLKKVTEPESTKLITADKHPTNDL